MHCFDCCFNCAYLLLVTMASEGGSGRERGIKILPLKGVDDIPKGRPADWLHGNESKCAFQGPLELLNLNTTTNYTS